MSGESTRMIQLDAIMDDLISHDRGTLCEMIATVVHTL